MLDQDRQEKTLSLNLKQRQQQRTAEDQARLAAENTRRMADGLMPVKSISDINATDDPDVVLAQASNIMADAVSHSDSAEPRVVRRQLISATP
jgi:hypothetical protein